MRVPAQLVSVLLALVGAACGPTDLDGDGFSDELDCDDGDAGVFPGAEERCDGVDQDCDGWVDEAAVDAEAWYWDGDGDGHGRAEANATLACEAPPGMVSSHDDCDDDDPAAHGEHPELCDGVDNCRGPLVGARLAG